MSDFDETLFEDEEMDEGEPEMSDHDEAEKAEETEEPKFVLVELPQLKKLLQRCPKCGKLPQGKSAGKPRNIKWTKNGRFECRFQYKALGTNMTATVRCSCVGTGKIRWATQSFIPGAF